MALFLLVDTSTKNCSVVLAENEELIAERFVENTRSHAALLPGLFNEVLKEANKTVKDIDALVIGEGPGSYTGLRIGFAAVKALAYTLNKPIIFVDTLLALAYTMQETINEDDAIYISSMKSRKGELYYCVINNDREILEASKPAIFSPELFNNYKNSNIIISGNNLDDLNKNNIQFVKLYKKLGFKANNFVKFAYQSYVRGVEDDYVYKNPNYLKPFMA